MVNEYQPKGGDALWLGSKGIYGLFADKKLCVAISERFRKYVWYLKVLYKCPRLLYLAYFT